MKPISTNLPPSFLTTITFYNILTEKSKSGAKGISTLGCTSSTSEQTSMCKLVISLQHLYFYSNKETLSSNLYRHMA